jgi:excinuclease ABC subunit C
VLEEMGLEDICVASLAKRFEEVYVPGQSEPVRIPRDSEALYLLQQVRDEAHRFAITYHRQLRGKTMTRSVLDDVPGLGPVRKARLLKEHGSVKRLRSLAEDDLVAIPWLPEPVARALFAQLHGERSSA